jgi:hypothetical protein
MKKGRHERIALWAVLNAGSVLDLDDYLEVADIEYLLLSNSLGSSGAHFVMEPIPLKGEA